MTSKNKYIKTLDKFLDIMKSKSKPSFYENEKDQIAEDLITACKKADLYDELNQNPTLSECIKEWNEKGFDVDVYALEIVIHNYSTVDKEEDEIEISIRLDKKTIFYVNDVELSFDLHHLLSKTIKALEVEE